MKIFAFCSASFAPSVRRAAGVEPVTCPPLTLDLLPPHFLDGYDFYYFKLHGLKDQPYWYGDNWVTAIDVEHISKAKMNGSIVFVANCFLPESQMLWSLLKAGCRWVVGGAGKNYARPNTVDGADTLGKAFRQALSWGMTPKGAFRLAKVRAALIQDAKIRRDTLGFQLWQPGDSAGVTVYA
jgi:hypothetical protein